MEQGIFSATVHIDAGATIRPLVISQGGLVSQAVAAVTQRIFDEWQAVAYGGKSLSWSGGTISLKAKSGEYGDSLQQHAAGLMGEVWSDHPHAKYVEDGHGPIDLKPGLLRGPKHRFNPKTGRTWNVVPFRWRTPAGEHTAPDDTARPSDMMTPGVYAVAKDLEEHQKLAETYTDNRGVERPTYGHMGPAGLVHGWGSSLGDMGPGMGNFKGMYRFGSRVRTPMGGTKSQTQYVTFRTVSDRSPASSWIVPAVPPRPVTQALAEKFTPIAEAAIEIAAIQELGINPKKLK